MTFVGESLRLIRAIEEFPIEELHCDYTEDELKGMN